MSGTAGKSPDSPNAPEAAAGPVGQGARGRHRATLLRQISQVFRERGYEGATLTQLAAATGLGKASLYHHFPGGKSEMVDALVREATADLQQLAFAGLEGRGTPQERLVRFIDGFAVYLDRCAGPCLLGVLAVGSARDSHGAAIRAQFRDWAAMLARVFEQAGEKPKRAGRSAADLLDRLYGGQVVGALLHDPRHLRRTLKRLRRDLQRVEVHRPDATAKPAEG